MFVSASADSILVCTLDCTDDSSALLSSSKFPLSSVEGELFSPISLVFRELLLSLLSEALLSCVGRRSGTSS
ncbi:hypothetical protein EVA_19505 [gut metagenome]|uniref:Uncharacterized protein n=1 Tax=gut metagenome TaxID=749906 RepID=J9FD90_9ZZZZ